MKSIINVLITCSIFIVPLNLFSQNKLNNFIANMANDKLVFEVAKVGISRLIDSNRIELPKILVFVKSSDVEGLLKTVKKNKVVKRLIPLLNDSTKDWYANVLLYQITDRDASALLVIENRNDWIKRNRENDIEYWHAYQNR